MSPQAWQEQNNRYLAASLHWLRLRLQQVAAEEPQPKNEPPRPAPAPDADKGPGRLSRWLGGGAPSTPAVSPPPKEMPLLSGATETKAFDARALAEAAAARDAAAKIDPPPALVMLAQRLGLSDFERDALLLCAAIEYDPGFATLYARAHGSGSRNYPTFAIALAGLENPSWEALAAHGPLRQDRLVEINQPGSTPLTSSALRADERIVNFLKGLNVLDERLAALLTPVDTGGADVADSQNVAVDSILQRLHESLQQSVLPVVQLVGIDSVSKLAVARRVCATLGRQLYRASYDVLPHHNAEIETLARLWQRETFLLPVALYIDAENLDSASPESQAAFERFLSRGLGLVFVGVREGPLKLNAPRFTMQIDKPAAAEQFAAWKRLLTAAPGEEPSDAELAAARLAGQFNLNLDEIEEAAALAVKAPAGRGSLGDRAWDTCRDLIRPRLDTLAQRIDVKADWNDLVLPAEQESLLRAIAAQVRGRHRVYDEWGFSTKMNRGFGITALFAGESGTGKTLAAEVLAGDLRLNLYRIDLSAVVSKYIGETEKNLRRLFDAADAGGVILFFDEADALFGKRSEVKDSHDRYANIEINYLLTRIEAFRGLAILATNQKSALDPAFMRRIRFVVNFPFPGIEERKRIWERSLPLATPKEALDYERLAKLGVSGGNIHSIALNAAFMAAEKEQPVTMPLLLTAARMEMRKLEKPFSESEFRI